MNRHLFHALGWFRQGYLGWLAAGLLLPMVAAADPFTDHFDPLIAELQARSAALSNSTDKAELKQKKAVDKVLATLLGKDSDSLATDIKNAGKLVKSLLKAFPDEFAALTSSAIIPQGGIEPTLPDLLNDLFDALSGEIQQPLVEMQSFLDEQPSSQCKDKAQQALDAVANALATANAATEIAARAKALGAAAKGLAKAESAVDAAADCGGGGGGVSSATAVIDEIPLSAQGDNNVQAFYYPDSDLLELAITFSNGDTLFVLISLADPIEGPHPFTTGAEYVRMSDSTQFNSTSGVLTITRFEPSANELVCSLEFSAAPFGFLSPSFADGTITPHGEVILILATLTAEFYGVQIIGSN